jgi:S-formylglutathione hydrolase FrmB
MKILGQSSIVLLVALAIFPSNAAAEPVKDANGFFVHSLKSEFQNDETSIRVLLPDRLQKDRRYPVVYLLPVEAKDECRYGNGLLEAKKHDLHNRHQVIFAAPTFSQLPWYADHPTDKTIRQESYFIKDVVLFVEKNYPAIAEPKGRLLLGFSKSGWGAWTLLLRYPGMFGRAAAFDAPMMMEMHTRFGAGPIFGTEENFENYRVVNLLEKNGEKLGKEKRLILLGVGSFKTDHEKIHALMDEKKIPHAYTDGPMRKHDWHSGWVQEGVEYLLK